MLMKSLWTGWWKRCSNDEIPQTTHPLCFWQSHFQQSAGAYLLISSGIFRISSLGCSKGATVCQVRRWTAKKYVLNCWYISSKINSGVYLEQQLICQCHRFLNKWTPSVLRVTEKNPSSLGFIPVFSFVDISFSNAWVKISSIVSNYFLGFFSAEAFESLSPHYFFKYEPFLEISLKLWRPRITEH